MPTKDSLKMDVWKNIYRLIYPHRKRFLLVVFVSLLSTGTNLIEPLIYREAINDVAGLFVQRATDGVDSVNAADTENPITNLFKKSDPDQVQDDKEAHQKNYVAPRTPEQALKTLLLAVLFLFAINVLGQLFVLLEDNINVNLACTIEQSFIQKTFHHVLKMPLTFFAKRSSATLVKQVNQSEEVSAIVNGFAQQILPEIISLVGILVIMFWQNAVLTLIALAVIPIYVFIAIRSANKLEAGMESYYEKWDEISSRMQDAFGGIKTVKLSGSEKREALIMKNISDKAYQEYIDRQRKANTYNFWENMLTRLATALVLGYGGYLTLKHQLTPGDVVMFVAFLDRLYSPIDSLASLWVNLQQNVVSVTRAFKLLDNPVEENDGNELTITTAKVEFKNVRFGYTTKREVLKNVSFSMEPGKVTAFVGTSGAGKTTAVDLLMKLYEPTSGEILIDGENIATLDPSSVRAQVGMVSADGSIFRGTLADNIRYKRPEATDEEVLRAAHAAGMESTLQRLPSGLHTSVGESGIGLSVGERQRIQIARVLVAQPRILVLDEATANLDYATEAEVKKTIEEIRKNNTVIIIAHRYSMVRDADHVVVLSAGEVIEQGSPQQLIENKGWFYKFAKAAEEK